MSLSKQNSKPKYCKVCHDTGKDEKTYTSHYVRETPDPASRIVCPTLLNMECKYCFKKGHTVKFCKVIKKRSKEEHVQSRKINNNTKNAATTTYISKNIFDLLECDDNEVEIETVLHHTPHVFSPRSPTSTPPPAAGPGPLSYAKIIEVTHKQLAEEEMDRMRRQAEEEKRKREEQLVKVSASSYFRPIMRASMINWADDTSSDEEEYAYAE